MRWHRFLLVFCVGWSTMFIKLSFDSSRLMPQDGYDKMEAPCFGKQHNLLTTHAHNNTIQTLMLSPQPGVVVGIGTTAFIPCPLPKFFNGSFELRSGTIAFPTSSVHNEELQGGPLIVVYFYVGVDIWNRWINNNPCWLEIVDRVLNTRHSLLLQMDPAIRTTSHSLSATTTIRKQYRTYNGLGRHIHDGSNTELWSDEEVMDRLVHWLDFHRKAGVEHFYLIDNEVNLSKPHLPIVGSDISYFRAPHMPYDCWRCYSDEHIQGKQYFTVTGQLMLENSILRLAHTQWLLFCDVDEFFVVGDRFQFNLLRLIEHYSNYSCLGEKPIRCEPLNETAFEQNFCLNFLPQIMSASNERLFEVVYRFKPIVRPQLTSTISVHYSLPFNTTHSTKATIPPRHGWLAHFNKRGGVGNRNWTWLLSNVHNHSSILRLE